MTLTEIETAAQELCEEEKWCLLATMSHSFRSTVEERAYYAEAAQRSEELLDGRTQGITCCANFAHALARRNAITNPLPSKRIGRYAVISLKIGES